MLEVSLAFGMMFGCEDGCGEQSQEAPGRGSERDGAGPGEPFDNPPADGAPGVDVSCVRVACLCGENTGERIVCDSHQVDCSCGEPAITLGRPCGPGPGTCASAQRAEHVGECEFRSEFNIDEVYLVVDDEGSEGCVDRIGAADCGARSGWTHKQTDGGDEDRSSVLLCGDACERFKVHEGSWVVGVAFCRLP